MSASMGDVATDPNKVIDDPDAAEAARQRGVNRSGQVDRRSVVLAAVVLLGLLAIGVVGVALFADDGAGGRRQDTQGQLTEDGGAKPHIIDRPNSGTAPEDEGDRGGWEQIALFAVMVVAVGGIGFVAFRSRGRARAGRQAWAAAGATGRDGAVEDSTT